MTDFEENPKGAQKMNDLDITATHALVTLVFMGITWFTGRLTGYARGHEDGYREGRSVGYTRGIAERSAKR